MSRSSRRWGGWGWRSRFSAPAAIRTRDLRLWRRLRPAITNADRCFFTPLARQGTGQQRPKTPPLLRWLLRSAGPRHPDWLDFKVRRRARHDARHPPQIAHEGTVLVDGKLFARYALTAAEPARDYGASLSLKIWPVLEGQGKPGWYEQYERVRAAIHEHILSRN